MNVASSPATSSNICFRDFEEFKGCHMVDLFNTVCFACLNPSLLKYFSITSMSIIKGSVQDNREHNSSSLLRAQKAKHGRRPCSVWKRPFHCFWTAGYDFSAALARGTVPGMRQQTDSDAVIREGGVCLIRFMHRIRKRLEPLVTCMKL